MENIIDSKLDLKDKLAEDALDMFRNCVEQLRTPGGSSIVDIYYGDDGSQYASRIRTSRSTEFNFKHDGQDYRLKEGFVSDRGLYRVAQQEGKEALTKVDSNSKEYDRAVFHIKSIDFDQLPRC